MVIVSPSFSALTAAVISPEGTSEARVVKAWNPFFPGETRRFFAPNAPRRTTSASTSSPLVSKPVTNTFEAVQRTPASSVTSISGSDGSPPESDAAATCHSRMPIDPSPSSSPQDWARMRSSVVVTGSKVITSNVSEARPYSPDTSSTSAHSSPSRYSKTHDFGGITPPCGGIGAIAVPPQGDRVRRDFRIPGQGRPLFTDLWPGAPVFSEGGRGLIDFDRALYLADIARCVCCRGNNSMFTFQGQFVVEERDICRRDRARVTDLQGEVEVLIDVVDSAHPQVNV